MPPNSSIEPPRGLEPSAQAEPILQKRRTQRILGISLLEAVLGLALALFAVCCCINKHAPPFDLFWQLRTGHDIVANHSLPHVDSYSWTRHGAPWVVPEWLSYLLFWEAFRIGHGFAGVWLVEIALAVATFELLFGALVRIRGCHPALAFVLTAGALALSAPYLAPRPQMATYLFLTLTAAALLASQTAKPRKQALWLLVPLFILWFNMHAGALVGVALIALCAAGLGLEGAITRRNDSRRGDLIRQALLLGGVALTCLATLMLTPYNIGIVKDFLATIHSSAAMDSVGEWRALNVREMIGKESEALMLVAALSFAFSRERRRFAEVLCVIAFSHEALIYTRNVPLFALVVVIMIAPHAQSALLRIYEIVAHTWPRSIAGVTPAESKALATVFACCALLFVLYRCYTTYGHVRQSGMDRHGRLNQVVGYTFGLNEVPNAACRFIEREGLPASMRMLNDYGYGGFLIWRLPNHPVFIDGRADLYFGKVLNDYADLRTVPHNWQQVLAPYSIDFVFVPCGRDWSIFFLDSPDWALVYADTANLDQPGNQLIFIRRLPKYAGLIAKCRRDCHTLEPNPQLGPFSEYPALH